jgi:hypothetical protein
MRSALGGGALNAAAGTRGRGLRTQRVGAIRVPARGGVMWLS